MNQDLSLYIFIGRSGCGKGTQAKLLLEHLQKNKLIGVDQSVIYQETGVRFREFIAKDNYSSGLEKALMEKSERAPDFIAVWIWSGMLIEIMTGKENLIIDGSPRSLLEAQMLDTAVKFYGFTKKVVLYIDVSREESKKRLESRGRMDDKKPGDIDKRLDWFDKDVLPAVEYYEQNPDYQFIRINGEQPIEDVSKDLLASLKV